MSRLGSALLGRLLHPERKDLDNAQIQRVSCKLMARSARAERAAERARRQSDAQISKKVPEAAPRPVRKRPAPEALPTPEALRPRSRPFVSAAKRARRQQRNTGAGVVRERPAPGACAKPGVPPFAIGGATTTTSARAERAAERARRRRKPGAQVPREVPTGMPGPQASRKRPAPGALQAPEPPPATTAVSLQVTRSRGDKERIGLGGAGASVQQGAPYDKTIKCGS